MNRTSARMHGPSGLLIATLIMAMVLIGCGGGKGAKDAVHYYGNYHLAGWMDQHPGKALADLGSCARCHELTVLKVGSGVPSCMTSACHHGTQPVGRMPISMACGRNWRRAPRVGALRPVRSAMGRTLPAAALQMPA